MLHCMNDVRIEVDAACCSMLHTVPPHVHTELRSLRSCWVCKNEKTAIFCFLFFVVWNLGSSELSSDFQASDRIDDKNSK